VTPLDPEIFARSWDRWYPDAAPFGHELRHAYPDQWLRIHNLPLSKRWPETAAERQEVLLRQNAVATDVLGTSAACWLIGYEYSAATTLPSDHPMASMLGGARS
jgi:hypothetical protein